MKLYESDPGLIKDVITLLAADERVDVLVRTSAIRVLQSFVHSQVK